MGGCSNGDVSDDSSVAMMSCWSGEGGDQVVVLLAAVRCLQGSILKPFKLRGTI